MDGHCDSMKESAKDRFFENHNVFVNLCPTQKNVMMVTYLPKYSFS